LRDVRERGMKGGSLDRLGLSGGSVGAASELLSSDEQALPCAGACSCALTWRSRELPRRRRNT